MPAVDSLFYSYTAKITSDFLLPLILFFRLLHSPIDRLSILCVLFPAPEVQPFKFEGGMCNTSRWGRAGLPSPHPRSGHRSGGGKFHIESDISHLEQPSKGSQTSQYFPAKWNLHFLEKATKVACLEAPAQLSSIWYDHTRAGGKSVHGWRNATYVNGVSSETPEWHPFRCELS